MSDSDSEWEAGNSPAGSATLHCMTEVSVIKQRPAQGFTGRVTRAGPSHHVSGRGDRGSTSGALEGAPKGDAGRTSGVIGGTGGQRTQPATWLTTLEPQRISGNRTGRATGCAGRAAFEPIM